jgi:hypothetical protein
MAVSVPTREEVGDRSAVLLFPRKQDSGPVPYRFRLGSLSFIAENCMSGAHRGSVQYALRSTCLRLCRILYSLGL